MILSGSKRVREFRRTCPDTVLHVLGEAINHAYAINSAEIQRFCPEIQQYQASQDLRALCEQSMTEAAAALGPLVTAAWAPNRAKNYSFYRIVVGGVTAVTQHRVADFNAMPRDAEWRTEQIEQQYELAIAGGPVLLVGTGNNYALITHGSRSATAAAPDFIRVRFPSVDGGADDGFIDVLDLMIRMKTERLERSRVERIARPKVTPKALPGSAS